jgi:hypothetical protein
MVSATLFPASGAGGCLREGRGRPMAMDGQRNGHGRKRHLSPGKVQFTYQDYGHTQSDTRQITISPTVATTAKIHRSISETLVAALASSWVHPWWIRLRPPRSSYASWAAGSRAVQTAYGE